MRIIIEVLGIFNGVKFGDPRRGYFFVCNDVPLDSFEPDVLFDIFGTVYSAAYTKILVWLQKLTDELSSIKVDASRELIVAY